MDFDPTMFLVTIPTLSLLEIGAVADTKFLGRRKAITEVFQLLTYLLVLLLLTTALHAVQSTRVLKYCSFSNN